MVMVSQSDEHTSITNEYDLVERSVFLKITPDLFTSLKELWWTQFDEQ